MTVDEQLDQLQALAKHAATLTGTNERIDRLTVLEELRDVAQQIADHDLLDYVDWLDQAAARNQLGISKQAVSLRVQHAKKRQARRNGGGS